MGETGVPDNEVRKRRIVGEVRLDVVARRIGEGEWELCVENELGIRSVCLEFFATAQSAVDAGMKAIESEGTEPFTDTDGFEYLLEDGDA